ncbi:MAG: glucokinase [Alphaproteobacteria bacterium]
MTRTSSNRVLLADVGGTNVRFAVLANGVAGPIAHMAVKDHRHFADALAVFLTDHAGSTIPQAILAVAGVVTGQRCELTNSAWTVDADELRARFGFETVRLLNDFEALGWALPHLPAGHLVQIGGGARVPELPAVVLGPGTGLGVAVYLPKVKSVLRSEAGHTTASSASTREAAVIERLRAKFSHVSVERLLSGDGLENIYQALSDIGSVAAPKRSTAEITRAARAESCPISRAAVDMFCALLGDVAGNLALTFCAQGGVFIAGGIIRHIVDHLPHSAFRYRFESKGRLGWYVQPIPIFVIVCDDPAFVGLRALALELG